MNSRSLSAIVITKNEESVLADCLESVRWADEIIVFDSASTDRTRDIALAHGARFIPDTEAWAGFGIQRQRAQSHAAGDFILMVDADERVTPELRAAIETVLQNPLPQTVWRTRRRDLFFGTPLRCAETAPVRLYPKTYRYQPQEVHESLDLQGAAISTLKGLMTHDTCRDFKSFQEKRLRYALDWAEERYKKGKRCSLITAWLHMLATFWVIILVKRGLMDRSSGILYAALMAQYTYNKYAYLWVLNRK